MPRRLSIGLSLLLLTIGLWNATLSSSEKGFYAMSFVLGLFAAVAVQKNVRDATAFTKDSESTRPDGRGVHTTPPEMT